MASRGIVFLMYHELEMHGRPISQAEPGYVRYVVPQAAFDSQMRWLSQAGWEGLSVSGALNYPAQNSVAITFDDGCETDLIGAAPILKEAGCNATFYITVSFLGKPGHMSPAQLRQLSDLGFEIGCHSMTHPYLDDLDLPNLKREISDSKIALEDMIGKKIEHFSCPGGRYDRRVIKMARDSGYISLATSRTQINYLSSDPFSLGRVAMMRDTSIEFPKICTGAALWKFQKTESLRLAATKLLGNRLYDRFRNLLLLHP